MSLDRMKLNKWLEQYQRAWEQQLSDSFSSLFSEDATYAETPFMKPIPAAEFSEFWQQVCSKQRDSKIEFEVIAIGEKQAVVRWKAETTWIPTGERRKGDGIFLMEFKPDGLCQSLAEWQHWKGVDDLKEQEWGIH